MTPRARNLAGLGALALAAGVGSLVARPSELPLSQTSQVGPPMSASSVPATADVIDLLAPVTEGSELAGFTVRAIHGITHGSVRVVCSRDAAKVTLEVALAEGAPAPPAATAGRFAVYYGLRGATPDEGAAVAAALAHALEGKAAAKVPKGMTVFTPDPHAGLSL